MTPESGRLLAGKRVLVTGGFGFIGSALVRELHRENADITVLGRAARPEVFSDFPDLKVAECDITSARCMRFLEKQDHDFIVHLAGTAEVWPSLQDPRMDMAVNLEATLRILEVLRNKQSKPFFAYGSTIGIYGSHSENINEDTTPRPASPYAIDKLAADQYVGLYATQSPGLRTVRLRYSSAYGPGLRKLVMYDMMEKMYRASREGTPALLNGSGRQVRDFAFVEDHARATVFVLKHAPFEGEAYNLGSGKGHSTMEIATLLRDRLGHTCPILPAGDAVAGDAQRMVFDTRKVQALGYAPKTNITSGLERTVRWFKEDSLRRSPPSLVSVIVPTYNERNNIAPTVKRIESNLRPFCEEYEIIFVDDSSPDGTATEVRELARKDPRIRLVLRKVKDGLGGAHLAGLKVANGEIFVIMDADCSQDPATMVDFLYAISAGADMVIGSRFIRGGRIIGQPPIKKYAGMAASLVARVLLGGYLRDFTHSYRAMKRETFETIRSKLIAKDHPSFCLEMSVHTRNAGLRLAEVPTTFVERTEGRSKLAVIPATLSCMKELARLRKISMADRL